MHPMQALEKVGLQVMQPAEQLDLAMITLSGEMGYPGVLSAPNMGF